MPQTVETRAKPFLKWAGGKGQLIGQIEERLPKEILISKKIGKYFEPFVGGGAVFFWLAGRYDIKKACLYDINSEIIMAYKTVKGKVAALIEELKHLEEDYYHCTKPKKEDFYYRRREEYNQYVERKVRNDAVRRTALIVFLNRTCFNGLFRVNSRGLFNVPFGRYEKPTICDEENLMAVSKVLKTAEIACCDFSKCLEKADSDSLVYFDPPYRPISKTSNFTSYIKNGFGDEEQIRLKKVFDKLGKMGAKVILSNSDPKNINPKDDFFDDLYRAYRVERLAATRMINCDASKRGSIKEVLITNY